MGLFDFLKSKKTAEPTPAVSPTPSTPAPEATGPRYKRPNYTSSTPVTPHMPPVPPPQEPIRPLMPPMPTFEPNNALEVALLQAAQDPAFRSMFYQELLRQELVILPAVDEENPTTGLVIPEPGMQIQLQVLNDGKLPVFSSLDRVYENGAVSGDVAYMLVPGIDFFRMVQGAECVLNPFSPFGKLLTVPELEDLLAGNLTDNGPQTGPDGDKQVSLGQPEERPEALIHAVRVFCASHPAIETVYLAQLTVEDSPTPPRLLLGFTIDNEDTSLFPEMGPIVQGHLQQDQTIDLMLINPSADDPLANYFRSTEPIYQRG
ncbi:enhanced serine sensitivity protein SseB C-terminal domain-containing protein [Hymenobacter sp. BT730]|uniref:enhanced serine sensitivity protein SseB C-terminal domain-containing protein n=1 Tax=Hymenobacter sp. BT730 TaxID=3063332 RepID=UPI0026E08394|nr:enhanced serine sensitivity protein SseB C-terminal domain-containing protein [Hymenobacter sp. BT730]